MRKTPFMLAIISGLVAVNAASADLTTLYSPYADLSVKRFAKPVQTNAGHYIDARAVVYEDDMPSDISYSSFGTVKAHTQMEEHVAKPEMDLSYRLVNKNPVTETSKRKSVGNIVLDIVNDKYYGFIPPKTMGMMPQTATKEMVALLEDPYSEFIPADEIANQIDPFEKQYNGIGVHLISYDGGVYVFTVVPNGAADKAGMVRGDRVLAVDGMPVEGLLLGDVAGLIQGNSDTYLKVSVARKGRVIPFILKRVDYTISGVELYWADNVPVLKLERFDMPAIKKALELLRSQPVTRSNKGLIIDLRGNEGGTITSAVALSEVFTNRRQPMFSTEDKDGRESLYMSQQDGEFFRKRNIVILQNRRTASAAEMFVALMQETKKAQVIGTPSRGKNTVQEVFLIHDGSILKLTVAQWKTAAGKVVSESGIVPDVLVNAGNIEQQLFEGDLQLQAALDSINS